MLTYLIVGAIIGVLAALTMLLVRSVLSFKYKKYRSKPDQKADRLSAQNADTIEVNLVKKISIASKDIRDLVRNKPNPEIKINERLRAQSPVILKYKEMTFAILYDTKEGLVINARLAGSFANALSDKLSVIYRVTFPNDLDWYSIPINHLSEKKLIAPILSAAYLYVKTKKDYRLDAKKRMGSCLRTI